MFCTAIHYGKLMFCLYREKVVKFTNLCKFKGNRCEILKFPITSNRKKRISRTRTKPLAKATTVPSFKKRQLL